ncbi:MAG: nucleoside-diphosphate kinase [Bacteroidota bacterium]
MAGKITFTMIKPSAFSAGYTGKILAKIEDGGYKIVAMKKIRLTKEQAGHFYEMHIGRPFYEELTTFMSSGPIVAAVLERENAVESFREFIGATDPAKAAEGTIRKLYGKNMGENAVHGSDSDESAEREAGFFFSLVERS